MKAAPNSALRSLAAELAAVTAAPVLVGQPLAPFTAYRIGGPSDLWLAPQNETDILSGLRFARHNRVPVFVLGRGSNVLISDTGWRGLTLYLGDNFSGWRIEGSSAEVLAGSLLNDVVQATVAAGLAGIELMAGIPGGIGGALRMNAGAFGQEIAAVTESVRGVDAAGEPFAAVRGEIDFGYRTVPALDPIVITGARFGFRPDDSAVLKQRVSDILALRARKQPLDRPSCGSVFKRPPGYYAGALIEAAGLKGERVGGAEVSRKHAGFILNVAHASARDVYRLIRRIEERVLDRFGVSLEREVKLVGEFIE